MHQSGVHGHIESFNVKAIFQRPATVIRRVMNPFQNNKKKW